MPAELLRRLARTLIHPFPAFPFLAGHVLSPTDALAERIGQDCTEAAFARPSARPVVAALARFLGDVEAERALKKEYHRVCEQRLRAVALAADPTERHGMDHLEAGPLVHPLDHFAQTDLSDRLGTRLTVAASGNWKTVIRHRLALLLISIGFLATALGWWLRHGVARVTPVTCRVASPNFWLPAYWAMLKDAAEEAGIWQPDGLLFVLEDGSRARHFTGGPFPTVDPTALGVPRGPWLTQVVLPAFAFVGRILAASLWHGGDARTVEMATRAVNLAGRTLMLRRVAYSVRCRWYLDTEDNSSLHILRGIILRKQGAGVVRWLYTQNESPGIFLSYLGYDRFLSGGPFQYEHYKDSWYPGLVNVPVGQIRNDCRLNVDVHVAPEYRSAIEERLAQGQRMAVYFGGNLGVGFDKPMLDSFRAMIRKVAGRDDWFLVVKPKFREGFYDLCARDGEIAGLLDAANVILIHYPADGAEVCPAGWLIDRMGLGLTLPGSVQLEALTGGRALLAYWPNIQDTLTRRTMKETGLLYDDPGALEAGIAKILDAPDDFEFPLDWFRQGFDPFADDRALTRVAKALFAE